ncbi:uncharacterized protein [Nicotiana sylvestris]|uniref:uncharacterized protein n=1 Tax=Nicotiana sylvestris TaxID=4096 RepID=UPI00388C9C84
MPPLLLDWWRSLPSNDQINERKERAAKASEKLEYLDYSQLELEGKVRKRVTDCQNAEGNEGEHLAKTFLLVNLRELEDLINESIQPEEGEDITKVYDGWRLFFDGAANFKGLGIGVVLVLETCQHYPVSSKLRFPCTNNMAEYEACILGLNIAIDMNIQGLLELRKRFTKIEFWHIPRIQNGFVDALSTLSSMIQHPNKNFIDPIPVRIHNQPAYYAHVKEDTDGKPWFHDIIEYLAKGEYPEHTNHTQIHTLRRLSNHFFYSGGNLYRRTLDLGLLRCVDAKEASKLLEEIHTGTCNPHMNGFVLARKILKAGYFCMTVETDCVHDLMKAICKAFKIKHKNSIAYRP